jgi:hypothetical protein
MSDAEKISTMLLRDTFHARALSIPFFGDDATATIGGGFFQAGRFRSHKPAQHREHLRQARLQEAQELFGEMRIRHGAEMLSTRRDQSKRAKAIAAKETPGLKTAAMAKSAYRGGLRFAYN